MKTFYTHVRTNFFFYILILFTAITGTFSYCRFMIRNDYIVEYEGACDPAIEKCFVGCEDDECIKEYYYSNIQKYAPEIYKECGADITNCEKANVCLPEDHNCSITYCDPEIDGEDTCATVSEMSEEQNDEQQVEPSTEELLQDNNINDTNI